MYKKFPFNLPIKLYGDSIALALAIAWFQEAPLAFLKTTIWGITQLDCLCNRPAAKTSAFVFEKQTERENI